MRGFAAEGIRPNWNCGHSRSTARNSAGSGVERLGAKFEPLIFMGCKSAAKLSIEVQSAGAYIEHGPPRLKNGPEIAIPGLNLIHHPT